MKPCALGPERRFGYERALAFLVLCLAVCLASREAAGDDSLWRIAERGVLVWGADAEGGGPYVYPDPEDPARVIGFEVELAALLAGELSAETGSRVEARFFQGPWDQLPSLLEKGLIDGVLNGYEWSAERADRMESTIPYYVYSLQLLARAGDERIRDWEALRTETPLEVGVLGASAAERSLQARLAGTATRIVLFDGNTNAMASVVSGKIDATLQDLPIALFYRRDFPSLVFVGEPVDPGHYVVYLRKGEVSLRDAFDRAIVRLRDRGVLRSLYERYGIWTPAQEDPRLLALPRSGASSAKVRPGFFRRHGRLLLEAAGMTFLLSVASMPLAIVLGLFIALGRVHGPRALRLVLALHVEVTRGTPLMLQLFVIFYVLPIDLDPVLAAVAGLALNYSAYEAEIYRAGILAVPRGQMEAALSLGMSRRMALRRVVVPQAVRIVIPAVTNDFIALFKDTSVASVITIVELTKRYNMSVMNDPGAILPLAATAALLYLAMSYPLSVLSRRLEGRKRA